MDIALITANANQLRFIIEYNRDSPTYIVALLLIAISLILQLAVGIFLIFKGRFDMNELRLGYVLVLCDVLMEKLFRI